MVCIQEVDFIYFDEESRGDKRRRNSTFEVCGEALLKAWKRSTVHVGFKHLGIPLNRVHR